jgi:hypothetical protein
MSWSVVNYWFPGESDRAAELDRRNRELNARREAMGRQTPQQSAEQEARFEATSDYNAWDAQVWDGFKEGAAEGASATADTVRDALAAPINWTFRAIPWQLWAIGVVAAFVYLGGLRWLKGALDR